jgi:fatty-acyl-CoA synthase
MSSGAGNGWGLSADDAILAIPGFFHCNGWAVPFFGPMYGAKLVMPGRRADTEWLHRLIVEEAITVGPGVPTIWLSMLDHCRAHGLSLGRLNRIFSGGTAPPAAMIEAYFREFGIRTIHGWGMTETTSGSTMSFAPAVLPEPEALAIMRTPGKPLFGNEIRVADDNDVLLPRDGATSGHLQVRGAWIATAYFRRPDVDAATPDGWLRTGDVATMDELGFVRITDRTKDLIKSGGEWISSVDLENALMAHPALAEAAVIAIPDPKWSERPLACIVLKPGEKSGDNATPADLSAMLNAHLLQHGFAKWQLPDRYEVIDAVPRTSTGKFWKLKLRERFPR